MKDTFRALALAGTLALLLAGCPSPEPEDDTGDAGWMDADGDGIIARWDCDDSDPDEGRTRTWYRDADVDGYGVPDVTTEACETPSGFVTDTTDCDDADPGVHPGAAETWYDGTDQDCDGYDCFDDQDQDGFVASSCGGDDCEDGDPAVYPGLASDQQGLSMAWLCPGTFLMGSPAGEVGRDEGEVQHRVTLTRAFWIGVTEVTQGQFEAFMGYNFSYFSYSTTSICSEYCPVERVTWNEAAAFANAVSDAAGLERCYECSGSGWDTSCTSSGSPYDCAGYRLPTEAEWEYAARAGTRSAFSSGGDLYPGDEEDCDGSLILTDGSGLDSIAWYCGDVDPYSDRAGTRTVGTLLPNPWGLKHVHGNVEEWCHDWYQEYAGDATDPYGGSFGSEKVSRGGNWVVSPLWLRSGSRYHTSPPCQNSARGFRLARSASKRSPPIPSSE